MMKRHGFGRGEYKYFTHPLPDTVAASTWRRRGLRGAQPASAGHARHLPRAPAACVSRLRFGHRHTVGVIFHDAK